MKIRRKKKAQSGGTIDTTGLRSSMNRLDSALNSAVKKKVASGTKVWTPEERAKWNKERSKIGAPPAGFKPRSRPTKKKYGGKVKSKKK